MAKKIKKAKKTSKRKAPQRVKSKARPKAKPEGDGIKRTKIRVIGIGGGGGSIVSEIAPRMKKASFVIANTDSQALRAGSSKAIRFQFGQAVSHGLGTGMNAELGREAALQEKEKIKKLLDGQDLCIIVSCLGGGAGSGAAPIFAKLSQEMGNITYGIFTLPFKFEGERKMEIAKEALEKTRSHLNALSIIPNERVFQLIDKNTPLKQALSAVNKSLTESLEGLIETIYEPGLINIDFADFRTILEGKGRLVYLNTVEVLKKDGSAKDLITKVLSSPLYPYTIRGAKGVLFNIAGEKDLSLAEVDQMSRSISELASPEAKIIFGISQNQKRSGIVKITLLAAGLGLKLFSGGVKKKQIKRKKPVKEALKQEEKKVKEQPLVNERKDKAARLKPKKKRRKPKLIQKIVKAKEAQEPSNDGKVRKNALQIRQDVEQAEAEMLEREKVWETPAFLRRKPEKA